MPLTSLLVFSVGLVDDHIPWETITFIFRRYNPSLGVETLIFWCLSKSRGPTNRGFWSLIFPRFLWSWKPFLVQETNISHLITSQRADDLPFPVGYVTSSFLEGSEGSGVASDKCPFFGDIHSLFVNKWSHTSSHPQMVFKSSREVPGYFKEI